MGMPTVQVIAKGYCERSRPSNQATVINLGRYRDETGPVLAAQRIKRVSRVSNADNWNGEFDWPIQLPGGGDW
jgi:hypothetical protein